MELQPAYITIVEGPPPDFQEVTNQWAIGVLESHLASDVALVEMRAFDGQKLVQRCADAWADGRPARFNFPLGNGNRGELDIAAARWERTPDGDKLYLWVRLDSSVEIEDDSIEDDSLSFP